MRAADVSASRTRLIQETRRAQDRPRERGAEDEVLVGLVFPVEVVAERFPRASRGGQVGLVLYFGGGGEAR